MAVDFSNFDKQVNLNQLKKDAEEVKKNGGTGDFPEVPAGNYNVKLEKLEIRPTGPKSKTPGAPMLSAMFRIVEGPHKKQCLFFNRTLYGTNNDANMIGGALTWLESLEPSDEVGPVVFESYSQLTELVLDIAEDVSPLTYEVEYDPDEFNPISVVEAFE